MIDHKHKCIFIHVPKCAGTSIEYAFGLLDKRVNDAHYDSLYGWCKNNELFLHHATPQELLDLELLDKAHWDSYYKFIIIRNPWDRLYSDYVWMLKQIKPFETFKNFLFRRGFFKSRLTEKNRYYRGDHLNKQNDYLVINGKPIEYDKILRFENLSEELPELALELGFDADYFSEKKKQSKMKFEHYSMFYNKKRLEWVKKQYPEDIDQLSYSFERKHTYSPVKNLLFLFYHFNYKTALKKYKNWVFKQA